MAPHISLSYSRHSTYQQCPFKFASQYIEKTYPDDSDNFHFIKGNKKHKQLDNYIKCKKDPTSINMTYDGDVLRASKVIDGLLQNGYDIESELQLAVDTKWNPITWFSKAAMFRAICDFLARKDNKAVVGDWKTGKYRDYDGKDTGQLHLSSAIVFAHCPEIEVIKTAYFYIEHGQTVVRQFTREMFETSLLMPFEELFAEVNDDKEFKPCRNEFCNWCLIKDTHCPLFAK